MMCSFEYKKILINIDSNDGENSSIEQQESISSPPRFKSSETLVKEVTRMVRLNPMAVTDLPSAIHFLVTEHSVDSDVGEVSAKSLAIHVSLLFYFILLLATWMVASIL